MEVWDSTGRSIVKGVIVDQLETLLHDHYLDVEVVGGNWLIEEECLPNDCMIIDADSCELLALIQCGIFIQDQEKLKKYETELKNKINL